MSILQSSKEASQGEDRQHHSEGPADETETDRFREAKRKVAVLEANLTQRRRRGGLGYRAAGVLDVLPVKNSWSLN